jgi:protein TonB
MKTALRRCGLLALLAGGPLLSHAQSPGSLGVVANLEVAGPVLAIGIATGLALTVLLKGSEPAGWPLRVGYGLALAVAGPMALACASSFFLLGGVTGFYVVYSLLTLATLALLLGLKKPIATWAIGFGFLGCLFSFISYTARQERARHPPQPLGLVAASFRDAPLPKLAPPRPGQLEEAAPPATAPLEYGPGYPGGTAALAQFVRANLQYPLSARRAELTGEVYVQFTVQPTGRLTNIEVTNVLSPDCGAEALRVTKLLPGFAPGTQVGGRPVPIQTMLTFYFGPD